MSENRTHIKQDVIDQIAAINIVDVVSDYVSLKKKGVNYVGLCPFHSDTKPSFYVSPTKQECKCFACGEYNKVISFVQKMETLSYPQAIRFLGKKFNIEVPEVQLTPEEEKAEKLRDSLFVALSATQDQFAANLLTSPDTQAYLKEKRQVTDEIIELYRIGYAPGDNQLSKLFPSKGFKTDVLLSAGIVSQSDNGYVFDRFKNRVTFPFLDLHGRVVGFTGRDLSCTMDSKYLNSPETDLFHKSNEVFGLHQARKRISETEKAYIVEGQFDVTSFVQYGLSNTVGGSGTAFSDEQIKKIKRFANTIVLVYDGDSAGLKAAIRQIKNLLAFGLTVKAFILPSGLDPDDYARKVGEDLPKKILNGEKAFDDYIYQVLGTADKEKEARIEDLDLICDCISVIPDKLVRNEYIRSAARMFEIPTSDIEDRLKPQKDLKVDEEWSSGFHGLEELSELLDINKELIPELTFDKEVFLKNVGETPIIYAGENVSGSDIQTLRYRGSKLRVSSTENIVLSEDTLGEEPFLQVLKNLYFENFDITITEYTYHHPKGEKKKKSKKNDYTEDEDDSLYEMPTYECSFCDYYIDINSQRLLTIANGTLRAQIISRCVDVLACLPQTVRTVLLDGYAILLRIKASELKNLLKPLLASKKDQSVLATQRLDEYSEALPEDPNTVPEYVLEDEAMEKEYRLHGFYPLCSKEGKPIAYMFRNDTGGGHRCISDFYMEPLLHIHSLDEKANKRVIKLSHMHHGYDCYVEWQSSVLSNLSKVNEKLIGEGPYNYEGTLQHFKKIWKSMSYKFTKCTELHIFGQQPEGFYAFGNAIFHKVKDESTNEVKFQISKMNHLGVVEHDEKNYYSPAFSDIYLSDRNNNDDLYKQIRYTRYKDIPDKDRLSFDEWSILMNDVYKINDNGKWAILYAITCAFRDFIFRERRFFTALFFIGPTSSGKSQVATSIRNLFTDVDMPLFNLNTGSFASLFMQMESFRNIPLVLDEYNDDEIKDEVFQALKAATLDGVGRTKVVDTASKITSSSEINTSLVLLGQEAPQKDDGSLSNRCILCEVPYAKKGEFTEHETAIFERLKKHERIGLCNILTDILSLRPLFEKHYLKLLDEEIKKLKEKAKINVTNTEGFTRILNAVSLMSATCRLITEHTSLKLPFTYNDFAELAVSKIIGQLEKIATTNKLATFFQSIDALLTRRQFINGREFKIETPSEITVRTQGKATETMRIESGTKVVYFDINAIHKYYEQFIGNGKAATKQTIESYFNGNPAYLGYSRATRYSWEDVVEDYRGNITPNANGDKSGLDPVAQRKIKKQSRLATSHIFNYDILKSLMDIDLERIDDDEQLQNDDEPPMNINDIDDKPF